MQNLHALLCTGVVVSPVQKMVGCYKDTAVRAMRGPWFHSQQMSVELCVDVCGGLVRLMDFSLSVCLSVPAFSVSLIDISSSITPRILSLIHNFLILLFSLFFLIFFFCPFLSSFLFSFSFSIIILHRKLGAHDGFNIYIIMCINIYYTYPIVPCWCELCHNTIQPMKMLFG